MSMRRTLLMAGQRMRETMRTSKKSRHMRSLLDHPQLVLLKKPPPKNSPLGLLGPVLMPVQALHTPLESRQGMGAHCQPEMQAKSFSSCHKGEHLPLLACAGPLSIAAFHDSTEVWPTFLIFIMQRWTASC